MTALVVVVVGATTTGVLALVVGSSSFSCSRSNNDGYVHSAVGEAVIESATLQRNFVGRLRPSGQEGYVTVSQHSGCHSCQFGVTGSLRQTEENQR